MDSLSFAALAASAFPILFTTSTYHIEVPHCKGIVALSCTNRPCITVDPEKYPSWECIGLETHGLLDEVLHSECIKHNTGAFRGYYCTCSGSPRYQPNTVNISDNIAESFYSPSTWYGDTSALKCAGCRDNHAEKISNPTCPFCGGAHD
jgi:hypothetical protein